MRVCLLIAAATLSLVLPAALPASDESERPDTWLRGADDDVARFERLERYLGGFSGAMWEVGQRYRHTWEALERGNTELAVYHWEKIGDAIRGGYLKRPARRANSDALFLDTAWSEALEAMRSGDEQRAWRGFAQGREACMQCHQAENVGFMNDQPLFTDLPVPERGGQGTE